MPPVVDVRPDDEVEGWLWEEVEGATPTPTPAPAFVPPAPIEGTTVEERGWCLSTLVEVTTAEFVCCRELT